MFWCRKSSCSDGRLDRIFLEVPMKRIVVVVGLTLLLQDTLYLHHQRLSPMTIGGEVLRKTMLMKGRMTVVVVGGAEDSPWLELGERDLSRIL